MCQNLQSTCICNWTPIPYVSVFPKFVHMLKRLIATVSVLEPVSKKERQGITGTPPVLVYRVVCSSTTIRLKAAESKQDVS